MGDENAMSKTAIGARLRAICLALPEAHEETMRRGPSYRVGDKIFASSGPGTTGPRSGARSRKTRALIIGADPARFFIPPYFGAKGWIGVGLVRPPTGRKSRRSSTGATG